MAGGAGIGRQNEEVKAEIEEASLHVAIKAATVVGVCESEINAACLKKRNRKTLSGEAWVSFPANQRE